MGDGVVGVGVPEDGFAVGEVLVASVPGGDGFVVEGVAEVVPSAEAVVGGFNRAADPVSVENVGCGWWGDQCCCGEGGDDCTVTSPFNNGAL